MPLATLPPAAVRIRIRNHSLVSEGTLRRFFCGGVVKSVSRERIEKALAELGLADLMPQEAKQGAGNK